MYVDGEFLLTGDGGHTGTSNDLAQTVTASAASTNYYDQGVARDQAIGDPGLWAVFVVSEAFTDSGSDSTVAVTLESDDNSSFSSATTIQTIGTFAALSAVGTVLKAKLQPMATAERYIRAYFTLANGNLTTGKIIGFITPNVDAQKYYTSGITIA